MEKGARKRREDPSQESIVSKKDELNMRVKQLIALWIETKRGWNGRPAPAIGINEKGNIKNPLPEEVTQAAKAIDMKTDEILNLLRSVTDEQRQYSAKRRKSRKEIGSPPTTVPELAELPKAASIQKDAGKVSRFMSHVKAPFQLHDPNRWERLRMLRTVARISSLSKDIENLVLTDGPTIAEAVYKTKDLFYYLRHNLVQPLLAEKEISDEPYTSLHSEFASKKRERRQEAARRIREKLKEEKEDAKRLRDEERSEETQRRFQEREEHSEQQHERRLELERMRQEGRAHELDYVERLKNMRAAVNALKKEVKEKPPELHNAIIDFEMATTFEDQVEAFERIKALRSPDINKAAHNILTRWMKRKRMEYQDTRESELRLSIDQELRRAREHLNQLMKGLETPGISIENALDNIIGFMRDSVPMLKMLSDLAEIYNDSAKTMQFETKNRKNWPIISSMDMRDLKAMAGIMYEDALRLTEKLKGLKETTISEEEVQQEDDSWKDQLAEVTENQFSFPEEAYGLR